MQIATIEKRIISSKADLVTPVKTVTDAQNAIAEKQRSQLDICAKLDVAKRDLDAESGAVPKGPQNPLSALQSIKEQMAFLSTADTGMSTAEQQLCMAFFNFSKDRVLQNPGSAAAPVPCTGAGTAGHNHLVQVQPEYVGPEPSLTPVSKFMRPSQLHQQQMQTSPPLTQKLPQQIYVPPDVAAAQQQMYDQAQQQAAMHLQHQQQQQHPKLPHLQVPQPQMQQQQQQHHTPTQQAPHYAEANRSCFKCMSTGHWAKDCPGACAGQQQPVPLSPYTQLQQ